MKPNCQKITQVINYLVTAQGGNDISELKTIKLVWAADRYHLRKYARTVTGDNYVAMKRGPVGSSTKDVIEFETGYNNVAEDDLDYIGRFLQFRQANDCGYISAIRDVDIDELSDTDKEALDFAMKHFGDMSEQQIIESTHLYPEWKNHEQDLLENKKVTEINLLDCFSDPKDIHNDPFAMPIAELQNARAIYEEYI